MQAEVLALLAIDVDLSFSLKSFLFSWLRLTILFGDELGDGRDHIVAGALGDVLGEFAVVVRHDLQMRLLLAFRMNGDLHPVYGAVVRAVRGAENHSVRLLLVRSYSKRGGEQD